MQKNGDGADDRQSAYGLTALGDEDLVAQVANGHQAAYAELVQRHVDRFVALAERVMGERTAAEDAVQDSFLKLWTHADRFNPDTAKFTTWFYRVVFNRCLDKKRKKRPVALPEGFDIEDDAQDAEDHIADKELADFVKDAMQSLPERQQAAIELCYFEGLSNKEAADVLEVNIKALESLLVRGRKSLHTALGPAAEMLEKSIRGKR